MATSLQEFKILGLHPVVPSPEDLQNALEIQWGSALAGSQLERAKQSVREHFRRLFLIEVQIQPADADFDWSEITQPVPGKDRGSWQAPYDERPVNQAGGRWAFFLHSVDLGLKQA